MTLLAFYLGVTLLPEGASAVLGRLYYVYHSVFNLFLVSLFWALMADLFSIAESKRLFPPIAVGGTLGAITGSVLSWQLAERIGSTSLFLVAIGLLEAAVWMAAAAARSRRGRTTRSAEARPLGGHAWAGLTRLVQSPYLLGIALFIFLSAVTSTFLYFTELRLVAATTESVAKRTVLFANINIWTQLATLLAQAFVAGRIMHVLGVGVGLAILPIYCAAGLAVLIATPTLGAYTLVNALFRAVQRGVTRPARETLFTVVNREDKYKAKSCLDTFVARTGDAGGAQLERLLAAPAMGAVGLAGAVLPAILAWMVLAFALAAMQSRLTSGVASNRHGHNLAELGAGEMDGNP
jgi:AAA family ATP:ADP antiporter